MEYMDGLRLPKTGPGTCVRVIGPANKKEAASMRPLPVV